MGDDRFRAAQGDRRPRRFRIAGWLYTQSQQDYTSLAVVAQNLLEHGITDEPEISRVLGESAGGLVKDAPSRSVFQMATSDDSDAPQFPARRRLADTSPRGR